MPPRLPWCSLKDRKPAWGDPGGHHGGSTGPESAGCWLWMKRSGICPTATAHLVICNARKGSGDLAGEPVHGTPGIRPAAGGHHREKGCPPRDDLYRQEPGCGKVPATTSWSTTGACSGKSGQIAGVPAGNGNKVLGVLLVNTCGDRMVLIQGGKTYENHDRL